MVTFMSFKHAQRQARYVERKEALGQKRIMFWLTPEEKDFVSKMIENHRKDPDKKWNISEDSNINLSEEQSNIIRQIYNGTFVNIPLDNTKPYYHDFLDDPRRFWDKRLPDAVLVLEDKRKSVDNWRGIQLHGLGAFPVVWSIVYALKRYAYGKGALTKPRRKYFDLSVLPFEDIVRMIVGKAAMKANDRFKSTPLGFLTHQIRVSNIRVPKDQLEYKSEKCLLVVIDQHGKLRETNAFCDQIEQVTAWNLIPPILDSNERIQGWNPIMHALTEIFE